MSSQACDFFNQIFSCLSCFQVYRWGNQPLGVIAFFNATVKDTLQTDVV